MRTDALGSVTGTVNQSGQVVNTYRSKPYGALLAKTGTGADPKMGWVGTLGYRGTGRRQSESYVRARHYWTAPGLWTTADPLWPVEPPYGYAQAAPVLRADRSGLASLPRLRAPTQSERDSDGKRSGFRLKAIKLPTESDQDRQVSVW